MPDTRVISVTQSWPLPYDDGVGGGDPPLVQHQDGTSIQARARFDEKQENNCISDSFAKLLLNGLKLGSAMGIRWRGSKTDQTLETTYLKIIPKMECDLIIFRTSFSDYMDRKLTQEWLRWTTLNPFGCMPDLFSPKVNEEVTSNGHKDRHQCDNSSVLLKDVQESSPWDARQLSHIQSTAASHGVHFMNTETIEDLAPLFPQLISGSWPRQDPTHTLQGEVDENSTSSSNSSAWESATDVSGSGEEWSTGTSQRTLCLTPPERLVSLKPPQFSLESAPATWDTRGVSNTQGVFAESDLRSRTTLANGPSDSQPFDKADYPERDQNEQDLNKPRVMFDQSQLTDFKDHPGHKVWEWDMERERWRRRGGTTEADLFPDFFA
ncbi:hypothetical protein EDB80DRAFT_700834 [Ilyonectria destructans]|nr:hypothetical protein EDB80DRAFT_700834 [Ilyonectria destructans]